MNENDMKLLVKKKVDDENSKFNNISDENDFESGAVYKALDCNEDGDAKLYKEIHEGKLVYDHAEGGWFVFGEHHWQEAKTEQEIDAVSKVTDTYGKELEQLTWQEKSAIKAKDEEAQAEINAKKKKYFRRINDLQTLRRKKSVLQLARTGENLGISGNEWDSVRNVLGCANGIIDLKTGNLRPGQPKDYIKTFSPVTWSSINTPCPTWERSLLEMFDSNKKMVKYIQRLFGYAIMGHPKEHIFPIFCGRGRNGKGTAIEILNYILGNFSIETPAESLLKQKQTAPGSAPNSDMMALQGKRVTFLSETGEGRHFNVAKIKWLSGGDPITGRHVYGKKQINFLPAFVMFLLTNNNPILPADDYAAWKRIHLIMFNLSFVDDPKEDYERKIDRDLPEKLKKESSGILAWLVRGAIEYQKIGINPPQLVKDQTNEYRESCDVIGQFIDEICTKLDGATVGAKELYGEYRIWCDDSGHRAMSNTRFGTIIAKKYKKDRSKYGIFYNGIAIRSRSTGVSF